MTGRTLGGRIPPATSGFTMIEVLIVIAITIVLFFLLIRPLTDTLRYTKDAQLQAAAQDSARKTTEIMSREISNAAYVSDNATYAFNAVAANLVPTTNGLQVEQYSNFLNVQVPLGDPATGKLVANTTTAPWPYAHIYNAKVDLVMARHAAAATKDLYDPTAGGDPVQFDKSAKNLIGEGGSKLTATNLIFPLAPGTSMIRYFIALKDPDADYSNDRDHIFGQKVHNNTYILYRAQFSPTTLSPSSVAGSPPIYLLFATDPATNQPILDDPDFFRHVTANDANQPNWLDPAHGPYSPSDATAHNDRVDQWLKLAKPVITAPEIDLLELPHNSDRTLAFDPATGVFPGIPHYGGDWDPVLGKAFPIERTSIAFTPGAVSADAAPSTTNDYQSRGIAGGTNGVASGLPYIPTVYQATGGSWTRPYTIFFYLQSSGTSGLTQNNADYYYVTQAPSSAVVGTVTIAAGDLVEYYFTGGVGSPAFDVTQGRILTQDAIPVVVNEDLGTISFSVPAVVGAGGPSGSAPNPFNRQWVYTPPASSTVDNNKAAFSPGGTYAGNTLDLTQSDDAGNVSPLNNYQTLGDLSGATLTKYLKYAFITPGTLRIYGPDMTKGANYPGQAAESGNLAFTSKAVLYTEVSANTAPDANQYVVDYSTGIVTFAPLSQLMSADTSNPGPFYWPGSFSATYEYQCNMRPNLYVSTPISGGGATPNPANPLLVKVTYHSREYLGLTIGVRYIDSVGSSQNVVLSNSVKVGNLNR